MTARIPTRLKALVEKIDPLANFYKAHKPETTTIAITKTDWLFLMQTPLDSMRSVGFNINSQDGLTYGRFRLKPVDQTAEKSK